jgi:hypothetical protein
VEVDTYRETSRLSPSFPSPSFPPVCPRVSSPEFPQHSAAQRTPVGVNRLLGPASEIGDEPGQIRGLLLPSSGNVPSGSCEEIASRADNAIAKIAGVGRLRM